MASPPPKKILFPIADGTEPMEAILPIDTLRRSGADVTIASVENHLLVPAMYDINIVADALLPDCAASDYDLIALPGGVPGSYTLRDCGLLETKVKSQAAEGKLYAAICAAPAVALGSWGLLKGLRATCTPLWMDQMPADAVVVESRVVVDGQVVTSRGSGTAIEFGLALIEQLYGKEKADEVAEPMVIRPQQGVEFHMKELNSIEWRHNNPPQILVPIANGTEEMEAVMIIDILRRAEAKVIVASVEDKLEIVASRKVKLVADTLLKDALDLGYDLIVLPGGFLGAEAFSNSKSLVDLLKRQAELGKLYGAICASPAIVLEPHGLLKGLLKVACAQQQEVPLGGAGASSSGSAELREALRRAEAAEAEAVVLRDELVEAARERRSQRRRISFLEAKVTHLEARIAATGPPTVPESSSEGGSET